MRLRPRISFSGRKQLEDEFSNDAVSPRSDTLKAKYSPESSPKSMSFTTVRSTPIKLEKQSDGGIIPNGKIKHEKNRATAEFKSMKKGCSDHNERKVSKRERQKSCTSTAKVSEKKKKEKTPPTPKKQEVARLLSPKLCYSASKAVRDQIVTSPSTSSPSAAVLDDEKSGQSIRSSTIFDKCRAIISPLAKYSSESSPRSKSFMFVRSAPNKLEKQSDGGIIPNGEIKHEVDLTTTECISEKQSCSDDKGRRVSKRERQKSCTSTMKFSEKKHKERTPPTPKKQEVAQLLSPKLRYGTGKAVKSHLVKSPSTSSPLAAVLDVGSCGNSSYVGPVPKVADRIEAVNGQLLTCFFTKAYCFSNHFFKRDLMNIDGVNFNCVEQYYMYYKAKVFGDVQAANRIMLANAPASIKKIGSNIANFNQKKWRPIALQVMLIGALRKFEQNSDLRQHLFDTAGSILVEASPSDKYWGVGLGMKSPAIRDMANWPGQNVLGKTLTMVREKLLRRDEFKTERRVS